MIILSELHEIPYFNKINCENHWKRKIIEHYKEKRNLFQIRIFVLSKFADSLDHKKCGQ